MNSIEWTQYGPQAVLLHFATEVGDASFRRSRSIIQELENNPPHGLVEYVPAFTTILLEFHPHIRDEMARIVKSLVSRLEKISVSTKTKLGTIKIPVIYDGPDLDRVAKHNGLTAKEVCERHSATVYKVYMLGFSPGFPYLGDLDKRLHTPRLDNPRTRVSAGAVAIGGEHTGIYSVDGPGGWNIIGHTEVALISDSTSETACDAQDIFLLKPGDQVKFVT